MIASSRAAPVMTNFVTVDRSNLFNSFSGRSDGVRREFEFLRNFCNVLVDECIVDLLISGSVTQARIDDCLHRLSPGRRLPRGLA